MAKGFPYFKFIATEWLTGDIVFEDFELQGIFINICALYWHRDGVLTLEEINKRLKTERLTELTDRFILVTDGFISIKFLDEQLIDANHISKINSENGKKGGRKKATANRPLTESEANLSKEKERKEELNKSKGNNNFESVKQTFSKKYSEHSEIFKSEHTQKEYEDFQKFLNAMFRDFTIQQLTANFDTCLGIGDWKKILKGKGFMVIKPALEKAIAAKEGNRQQMALRIKTFMNGLLDEKVLTK